MNSILRLTSFVAGIALAGSVPFVLFWFAASVGDLDGLPYTTFTEPLVYTIPMALGNILVGLPNLVAGEKNRLLQLFGGFFLLLSFVITLYASIAFWPFLWFALFQLLLFVVFVWPARSFKIANTALQRDAPQAARP